MLAYLRGQRLELSLVTSPRPQASLTERQCQVAELVGRGFGTAGIAREIGCAPSTVKKHLTPNYSRLAYCDATSAYDRCVEPPPPPSPYGGSTLPGGGGGSPCARRRLPRLATALVNNPGSPESTENSRLAPEPNSPGSQRPVVFARPAAA